MFVFEGEDPPFSLAREKGFPSPSSSPTPPQNALFRKISRAVARPFRRCLPVPRQRGRAGDVRVRKARK